MTFERLREARMPTKAALYYICGPERWSTRLSRSNRRPVRTCCFAALLPAKRSHWICEPSRVIWDGRRSILGRQLLPVVLALFLVAELAYEHEPRGALLSAIWVGLGTPVAV